MRTVYVYLEVTLGLVYFVIALIHLMIAEIALAVAYFVVAAIYLLIFLYKLNQSFNSDQKDSNNQA